MYTDFDFHSGSGVAAILQRSSEGDASIIVTDLRSDSQLATIENRYLPAGPRISPDGRSLAFFGNGRIYVHSFEKNTTRAVFDRPDVHAGFPYWSPDGTELVFSAYDTPIDRSRPPKIFGIELATGKTTKISEGPGVDRFPHLSATGRY
ncbi:MAG: PD40 domain-containing protein, partial [Candidatus Latescibacteria bacterium]|nr:PD40 domain-containing protein [Candidatus Latescibacterota bacterium]